jgi:hypothetical protein
MRGVREGDCARAAVGRGHVGTRATCADTDADAGAEGRVGGSRCSPVS